MDEIGNKIIGVVVGAIVIYILQLLGVHKLIANIVGGSSNVITEQYTKKEETSKDIEKKETSNVENTFWQSTDKCGSSNCYYQYLRKYPKGKYVTLAKAQLLDFSEKYLKSDKYKNDVNLILNKTDNLIKDQMGQSKHSSKIDGCTLTYFGHYDQYDNDYRVEVLGRSVGGDHRSKEVIPLGSMDSEDISISDRNDGLKIFGKQNGFAIHIGTIDYKEEKIAVYEYNTKEWVHTSSTALFMENKSSAQDLLPALKRITRACSIVEL